VPFAGDRQATRLRVRIRCQAAELHVVTIVVRPGRPSKLSLSASAAFVADSQLAGAREGSAAWPSLRTEGLTPLAAFVAGQQDATSRGRNRNAYCRRLSRRYQPASRCRRFARHPLQAPGLRSLPLAGARLPRTPPACVKPLAGLYGRPVTILTPLPLFPPPERGTDGTAL
jgi:hypothetical protein